MNWHHHETLSLPVSRGLAYQLDPRAKLLSVLLALVALALTPRGSLGWLLVFWIAWLAVAELCLVGSWLALRRAAVVLPFVLLPLLLSPFDAGISWRELLRRSAELGIKSWLSAFLVVLLSTTTPLPRLCAALERLGAPSLLASTLLLTERYLSLLREELSSLWRAARLRGFRPVAWSSWMLFGKLLGALLLRTFDRAERVSLAMRARGFRGRFFSPPLPGWRGYELALLGLAGLWSGALLWLTQSAP